MSLLDIVNNRADTRIERCYQCGRCASGCPVVSYFDYPPYSILRLVLLGRKEKIFSSKTIWLCTSCYACMTRCPNDINITKTMDVLKEISLEEKAKCREKDILIFHKLFLKEIRRIGRINEFRFVGMLKAMTMQIFKDLGLGMRMFRKKKFVFRQEKIEGIKRLRELIK